MSTAAPALPRSPNLGLVLPLPATIPHPRPPTWLRGTAAPPLPRSPNLVLVFLLLAYILNFLDRQLLSILAAPIKADLDLSDTEFGAIAGLAFALMYSFAGVPLSYLADRTSRSKVIAGSLFVWSGFTALCGVAQGYWSLFLFRLGVGFGEAGGVAPSYALISDYFPPEKRGRALGIYYLRVQAGRGSRRAAR